MPTETSSFGSSKRESHDSSKFYNSNLYKELAPSYSSKQDEITLPPEVKNKILHCDARDMSNIPDSSVHLVVTSPPYNVSKLYDNDLSLEEYLQLIHDVFDEIFKKLIDGGRICLNIANIGRKPYIPLSDYVSKMLTDIGYYQRGEIIWNKNASAGTSTAWGSWQSASNPTLRDVHEYILVFSKGTMKRVKNERENTITRDQFLEYTKSIWSFSTVSAKKIGHPAPFPIELPYRCIQLYTYEHEVVLDPFVGSGQTALAALKSNRKYIGLDIDENYVKLAKTRINEFQSSDP